MKIRTILPMFAVVFLFGFGVHFCHSAKEDANRTYLLLSKPIDAARAEEIFMKEAELADSVGFCFWGVSDSQRVSCKETGGVGTVTGVLLSGNPALLDAGILAWQEGCFLDAETAQRLFGTPDCSLQTLWMGDRQIRVLGTFDPMQPTMVTAAEERDGAVLDRCILSVPAEQGGQAASQFLLRWGLQGERIDFYPLWVVVHNLLLILPGILLLHIFAFGIRKTREASFPERIRPMLLPAAAAALFFLLCSHIVLLPDMLPPRWSDFSFWKNWWEGQKENFQKILLTPMGEGHLQMMLDMVKSILSSTAAFLLALWTFRRQTYANTAD